MLDSNGMYYRTGGASRRTASSSPQGIQFNIDSFLKRVGVELTYSVTNTEVYVDSEVGFTVYSKDRDGESVFTSGGGGDIWCRVFIVDGEEILLHELTRHSMKQRTDAARRECFLDLLALGPEKRSEAARLAEKALDDRARELLHGWGCSTSCGRRAQDFEAAYLVAAFEYQSGIKFAVKDYKTAFELLGNGLAKSWASAWRGKEKEVGQRYVFSICQAAVDMEIGLEEAITELWDC